MSITSNLVRRCAACCLHLSPTYRALKSIVRSCRPTTNYYNWVASILFVLTLASPNAAQIFRTTDGHTPSGIGPGAPAGSHVLSDFEHLNYFNGRLSVYLPLLTVNGRGNAKTIVGFNATDGVLGVEASLIPAPFGGFSAEYTAYVYGSSNPVSNYGKSVLEERGVGSGWGPDENNQWFYHQLSVNLTFRGPDNTEHDFVDQLYGGSSQTILGPGGSVNFGKVFRSRQDSRMTFISDFDVWMDSSLQSQPMWGWLYMPDGSKLQIGAGLVGKIIDANGNTIVFDYDTSAFRRLIKITDSLKREVNFTYNVAMGAPYGTGDMITYKGFGGATRTIRKTSNPGTIVSGNLFPELNNFVTSHTTGASNTIWLPDDRKYIFYYNDYGYVSRIELPTGGAIEYDYSPGVNNGPASGVIGPWRNHFYSGSPFIQPGIYHRVTTRRMYPDKNSSVFESRQVISRPESINPSLSGNFDEGYQNLEYVEVTTYDYGGAAKSHEVHHFPTNPPQGPGRFAPYESITHPGSAASWADNQPTKIEMFNISGGSIGSLLRKTEYKLNTFFPHVDETTTTLSDTNQVSRQTFLYDMYDNLTDIYEHDYGVGAASTYAIRHTHTDYLTTNPVNGQVYDAPWPINASANLLHIRDRMKEVKVYKVNPSTGAETLAAKTVYEYDNYGTADNFHSTLKNWPVITGIPISGLDPAFTATFAHRGNPTAITQSLLDENGNSTGTVTQYMQYDLAGNVVKRIDPRSTSSNIIATSIDFPDCFGAPNGNARTNAGGPELNSANQFSYAFPTVTTNAMGQASFTQYDYYLGIAVDVEDLNGVVSSTSIEDDVLDRPKKLTRAANKDVSVKSQTLFDYDDANHVITTTRDKEVFLDGALVSKVFYDGFGRTTETRQYEGGTNYIAVKTEYDALGRPFKESNPFRPWQQESEIWTTKLFEDPMGRLTKITTPDNAAVTISYVGNSTTATDQSGKQRKSIEDALGRLKNVYEAPDDAALNFLTTYSYDVHDKLIGVSQGSQTRTFSYDSLGRLTSTINPEKGTISYQYDEAGNLLVRTDGRGVSAHFAYDSLSRIKRQWYNASSDKSSTVNNSPQLPSSVAQTDEVNFYYDEQALPYEPQNFSRGASIGRLVAVTYGGITSTTGDYYGYDSTGRNTLKVQRIVTKDYQLTTNYNAADLPTFVGYPSGNSVNYSYDSAARPLSFTGNLGGTSLNYATEATFSPFGALTKEKFGTTTTIYNKLFYNSRGQLSEIRESTSWTGATDYSWNRGAIINHYSDSCSGMCGGVNSTTAMPDNNGNLRKQDVYIPNHDQIPTTDYALRSQQYNYDKLNRLKWVRETNGGVDQWRQWFGYDQYGNRTIDTSPEPGDPHLRTWGAVNSTAFDTFDLASKNRLYAPGDQPLPIQNRRMQYDEVGNLKTDTYTGAGDRTYDAENKMTMAIGGVPATQQLYKYDASGQRIKRTVNGVETWAVYGFGGEMVAEYPVNGVATNPQKEYGYRNGQLLITASPATAGWGPPPTIDDNPLNPPGQPKTDVKAIHITQLRTAINAVRAHFNLSNYQWQKPTASGGAINNTVFISWEPIDELRTALDQALGAPANGYAAGLAQGQLIMAVHIQELRDRVLAAWQTGGTGVDIRWIVTDQLGTPRMVFDQSGSRTTVSRHDYLPFGEELLAGVGGRTTAQGYTGNDGLRQRFTLYERDIETSLDYAKSRYYASLQGRFTSPDQPFADQSSDNPQSWNLYSYVRNNPLIMIDATGRFGDYYNRDGSWAYTDNLHDDRVYVLNETREADGSINLTPQLLTVTHTQFTIIANIVRQESGTVDADENLWIAHTSNNEARANNRTLYAELQTGFSSAPDKVNGISTRDSSARANVARAGVLDVLSGGADPTGGARRWDGTDFLAWGLAGPYGSHAKFREFASIHISGQIFSTYENAQTARWGNSVTYYGTRYTMPAAVFTNAANWTQNRDFHYVTGARNQTRNLVATGAKGQTIFWRF